MLLAMVTFMSVIIVGVAFFAVGGGLIAFPLQIQKLDILNRSDKGSQAYAHFGRFIGLIFVVLSMLIFYVGLCPHGC